MCVRFLKPWKIALINGIAFSYFVFFLFSMERASYKHWAEILLLKLWELQYQCLNLTQAWNKNDVFLLWNCCIDTTVFVRLSVISIYNVLYVYICMYDWAMFLRRWIGHRPWIWASNWSSFIIQIQKVSICLIFLWCIKTTYLGCA